MADNDGHSHIAHAYKCVDVELQQFMVKCAKIRCLPFDYRLSPQSIWLLFEDAMHKAMVKDLQVPQSIHPISKGVAGHGVLHSDQILGALQVGAKLQPCCPDLLIC